MFIRYKPISREIDKIFIDSSLEARPGRIDTNGTDSMKMSLGYTGKACNYNNIIQNKCSIVK
jgi:hypothetical protein